VAAANRLGMRVLITDHHLPGATLPDAQCIINPNQPGCGFPSKHLAGVGVMFYLLLALRAELRKRGAFDSGPNLASLLDLWPWVPWLMWCGFDDITGYWCNRACSASAPARPGPESPR